VGGLRRHERHEHALRHCAHRSSSRRSQSGLWNHRSTSTRPVSTSPLHRSRS
jgi:hypothetical protein